MSYDELVSKYGAEAGDLDTVEKVLTSFGLTVTSRSTATRAVQVAGPVDAMEKAFGVQLFRVKHDTWLYRGRVGEIHIPQSLDGIVTGVFGLDSRPMIKHRKLMELQAAGALPPAKARPWYLPQELADAYRFPAGDGAGQTIGILEFGGEYLPHDLQLFVQMGGLPATPGVTVKNVHVLPPQQKNDPDAIGETMLDVEVIAGVCPKADIVVYFSQWTEKGWVDILDAAITDNATLSVLSISYGLAEGQDIWTQQAIDEINATLKELAAVGITVCAASGDDGSDDQVADGQAHVSFPASSPYVLSVGGTTLTRATGSEVAWFEGDGLRRDQGGSTGGGISAMNPRPSWQTANIPSVNPHAPDGRIVPDVAANAAGSTGYFMVAQNTPQVSGGTSAATPLWAALIARLRQAGKPVGFLTPLLYQANPNTHGQPLGAVGCNDITMGSNAAGTAAGYSAGVGFDAVTGWGSPDGAALLANLPLASTTLAKRPGQHVERLFVTQASTNAVMAWKGVEGDQGIWFSTFDGNGWAPQQNIAGVGTSVGPALAEFDGGTLMAWKGVEGDQDIWFSVYDGNSWAPQQNIAGVGTSVGPALAAFNGNVVMTWKGVDGDQGIWFSVYDGSGWTPQQNIGGVGTSVGPALAAFNGNVVMAWKGVDGDQGIWYSTFDGNGWSPQQNIAGVGTSFRPALAVFDGRLYMAWKGVQGDQGIWFSSFDGNGWAPQQNIGGVGTSVGPSLVSLGDALLMAWKGVQGDQGIWFTTFDGNGWAPQQNVNNVGTSVGPALALTQPPFMAWKGIEGDQGIWFTSFYGNAWLPQRNVGGVGTEIGPTLALFDGKIHMAWKGIAGDQRLWFSSYDGNGWAPQQNIPGVGSSVGPSLTTFGGRLFMVWKGVDGDQGIWFATYDGLGWSGQQNVPGVGTSERPSVVAYQGKVLMAWKGVEGDQSLWYTTYDGNGWAPQQQIPGVASSVGPVLTVYQGKVLAAWKGINDDQGIWFATFDGSGWSAQQNVPGVGTSFGPSLTVYAGKVFMAWKGIVGDQGVWFSTYDGSGWAPQQNIAGIGSSVGPALVNVC
ncbi:hypothetical protein BZL54_20850 [Burkholderia ubonensis subsp. mesacidophila]|uniref:Peptidase S53 domain-containing protein n=2 Tax=Burkholderia ubonensis TaxID=101571 RepID=A0A2A4FCS8_9BURK|nr:hypothetical protein BZL54_20850 [Burkholderia ubonensis subsp. mesacidophila]